MKCKVLMGFTDKRSSFPPLFATVSDAMSFAMTGVNAVPRQARKLSAGAGSFAETGSLLTSLTYKPAIAPSLDPAAVTPVYSGTFDVTPEVKKDRGKGKAQGKASTIATIIFSIGVPYAGGTWIAQVDPDFSLLSNTGKDALVGFGLKNANDFHIVGLKGDGGSGLNDAKVTGNWNALNSATVTVNSAPTNGTQAGPNWLKFTVSADGTTYTFYTGTGADVDNVTWTAEYSAVAPSPLTNVTDATDFGIAVFLPSTDIGEFAIDVSVWQGAAVGALVYVASDSTAQDIRTERSVSFDTEVYDIGGWHEGVTHPDRLTVPAGVSYVRLVGQIGFAAISNDANTTRILKNGATTVWGHTAAVPSGAILTVQVQTGVIPVTPGDYFTLGSTQAVDASLTIKGGQTWLAIEKVG